MTSMLRVWLVLLACASPWATASAAAVVDIPHQTYVLPNGLTLIVHEDRRSPKVAVAVWYRVGSKDERPGRTGIAHLYEHMMFNGSQHYDRDYHTELEQMGAEGTNGTTSRDVTSYFQTVPVAALDRALWLESDRMAHLSGALDQDKLDEQRGIVQNEKRNRENEPYGRVAQVVAAATYPLGHPNASPTLGTMADLDAITLDDLRDWGRTYYGAANAVLVVAGDVVPAEVRRKVEHYFADVPAGPAIERPQQWIAKMGGEHRANLMERSSPARIYKIWNIPGYASREFTLLGMAAEVLAVGHDAPLQQRLVKQGRWLSEVEVGVGTFAIGAPTQLGSQFQIIATLAPGVDAREAERALDAELARFLSEGPTAQQLDRVRRQAQAKFVRSLQSIDGYRGKAGILARNHIFTGDAGFFRSQFEWTRQATPVEVRDVARRWLADGVFVLNVEPQRPHQSSVGTVDRREPPPALVDARFDLPLSRRMTLSNDIDVVLVERPGAPVVDVRVLFDAGIAADVTAKSGTMRLTLDMLTEGTRKRTAEQIAARSDELSAELRADFNFDASWLALDALSAELPASLELMSDVLLDPVFPQASFDRLKSRMQSRIAEERADRRDLGARHLSERVFGAGHPYAQPASGSGHESALASLQRNDLVEFARRWLRPDNATILVVGDVDGVAITPLLEQSFGRWRAPAVPRGLKLRQAKRSPSQARVFLIDWPGLDQSMIYAAAGAPVLKENAAADIASWMLGGTFSSRLNMNLRESKHWTYGVSSRWKPMRDATMFVVESSVQTEHTAPAMQEILMELQALSNARLPSDAELTAASNSRIRSFAASTETVAQLATLYAEPLTLGMPDDYWASRTRAIQTLTPQRIGEAAAELYAPQSLTWLVIGDLRRIEQSIRKLSLGAVERLPCCSR